MLPTTIDAVTASYHRCMYGEKFVDTFYHRFLAKSPEVAEKFRHTDFERQKRMLRESLLMMIQYNINKELVHEELEKLGERHSRRGTDIKSHLYDLWLDALCESVKENDPQYVPQLDAQWREAMQPGIEILISKY